MNRVKNPFTERTLIFALVLLVVGGTLLKASNYMPLEYLRNGIYGIGAGIITLGTVMCVFVAIMECKYGQ